MRETAFIVQVVSQGRNMNRLFNWLRSPARCRRPNRRVLTSLALLLLAIGVPTAFAQHVVNPFAGATQYVNPDYAKEVNSAIATLPPGSALANQMSVVATYPTAVWLDRMAAITGGTANNGRMSLQQPIQAALAQQKGTQPGANIQQSVFAGLGFTCLV
jgi:cellulose 1,4-beta-cellobiosidase